MGKKSSLSENKRAKIVTLFNEGYSERQISVKVSCCKKAVNNANVNFNTSGSFRDNNRCGRTRKTILRDDHLIKRIATRSPTSSCGKIRAAVLQTGTDISSMTVSRRLKFECGLKSYKPACKPRLTAVMKSKHLPKYMKPGQLKTGAELCFQTNPLCNSLLRAKDTLEDPQVNDLRIVTQFKQ